MSGIWPRPDTHSIIVLAVCVVWVAAHLVCVFLLPRLSRDLAGALFFLLLPATQVLYGCIGAALLYDDHPAVAQGILMGVAITLFLPGLLCLAGV
jgi:hypothetical protein